MQHCGGWALRSGREALAIGMAVALALDGCNDGHEDDPTETGLTPKELLGKRLFEDATLSEPPGQSCATCHAASVAFADPDSTHPTSKGVPVRQSQHADGGVHAVLARLPM
jgi:cytochrome c peroxidase